MNEEKVIQDLKDLIYNPGYDSIILQDKGGYTMWHNMFEALLKLIEKLQKELEQEKEKNKRIKELLEE